MACHKYSQKVQHVQYTIPICSIFHNNILLKNHNDKTRLHLKFYFLSFKTLLFFLNLFKKIITQYFEYDLLMKNHKVFLLRQQSEIMDFL